MEIDPPIADPSVADDGEFIPCFSDKGVDDDFNDRNNNKSKDQNLSYSSSVRSTSYETSIAINAPNTESSVFNEHVNSASSSTSSIMINNDEIMYSQRLTPSNVTTVAELNMLNQRNVEIIEVDDNSMTSNNHSTIDENIMLSNYESTIASLMSLGHEQ